ncbi:MAG: hypothetical protein ABI852_06240 [Gemmatimonadaceae bacterium]
MPPVFRSLQELSTGYTVFERDQVLTHAQLNSVSNYADDQTRLTRVQLLGIGIVSGLQVSANGGKVTVSRGVGVTSDGDIVSFSSDTVFDRAKAYDKTFPAYAPLYKGGDVAGDMIDVFELVKEGTEDALAIALTDATAVGGRSLASMTAVLIVESYITDHDLCSGDDCDNLGQDAVNTLRLVVLDDADAIQRLRESLVTVADAFTALPELSAIRPQIPTTLAAPAELAKIYTSAIAVIRKELFNALAILEKRCAPFFGGELPNGISDRWVDQIGRATKPNLGSDPRVQYIYDFLRDLVDLYSSFRDQHLGDTSIALPPVDAFPKHVMLGVIGGSDNTNRTGFYPSPLVAGAAGEFEQSRFLLRTLDMLISRFVFPNDPDRGTRITPSRFVDEALQERAIPFYYRSVEEKEVHPVWNYRLQRRGRSSSIYGYDAVNYATPGSAAVDPLASQIGPFSFFRIEGHVGQKFDQALADIEGQIVSRNLPFGVVGVLLGKEPGKVVRKPPRITDLHYVHKLVRQDMAQQMVATKSFSATVQNQVVSALDNKGIADSSPETDNINVRLQASQQNVRIGAAADLAVGKLAASYATYTTEKDAWKSHVTEVIGTSGQLKRDLTSIIKTDFTTPIDTLIASPSINWLPWLDDIIQQRDDKAAERLLFSKFAEQHPQLEHFAGVTRGGTFVLVYDATGLVVADFMLPYFCPKDEEELIEPKLTDPQVQPTVVKDQGISIQPSRKSEVAKIFDQRWTAIRPEIEERINLQKGVLDLVEKAAAVYRPPTKLGAVTADLKSDEFVKGLTTRIVETNQHIADLETVLAQPDTSAADKTNLTADISQLKGSLTQTMESAAIFVATTDTDVSAGTQGAAVLEAIAVASPTVAGTTAAANSRANIERTTSTMTNTTLKQAITKNVRFQ